MENAFYVEHPYQTRWNRLNIDLILLKPVAIGTLVRPVEQSDCAIAIGQYAGYYQQGACAVAIGEYAGYTSQGADALALAPEAGAFRQGTRAVALGVQAGQSGQQMEAVALGAFAGARNQGSHALALGDQSGQYDQGAYAIALGHLAGQTNQPTKSIVFNAMDTALSTATKSSALYVAPVASGTAGNVLYYDAISKEISYGAPNVTNGSTYSQYLYWDAGTAAWTVGGGTIRLGEGAGFTQQQTSAVALGVMAGYSNQGSYAIAIGREAGKTNQPNNSIVLNATGAALGTVTKSSALYVAPVASGTAGNVLYYDAISKEISYGAPTFTGSLSLQTYTYAYFQARDAVAAKVMFTDCADKDAFYRLRVSEPSTLFEGSTIYDPNPLFFDNDVTANASISGPVNAAMTLAVTAASTTNQYAARQTHFYAHYQPGKSFCAYFSFCFGAAVSGVTRRVGLYDVDNLPNSHLPLNGVVLEQTLLGGLQWRVYQGDGVNYQSAAQSSWNVDPLNGSGPSGITLNPVNNLLGFVDLEWLGVGRVRVGFFFNGVPVVCHAFNNNSFSIPYLNNPFLPIRCEIRKTDTSASTASMRFVCCTIMSEGGFNPVGIIRATTSPTLILSNTQVKSCLAIRLRSGFERAMISPMAFELVSKNMGGNAIAFYSVYLWRPSSASIPSGATWGAVTSTSIAESTPTDLYTQMMGDTAGIRIQLDRGSISARVKTAFQTIPRALSVAQSSVLRDNRDILVFVVDNNNVRNNKEYVGIPTWREING